MRRESGVVESPARFVDEVGFDEIRDEPARILRERIFASKVLVVRRPDGVDVDAFVAFARRLGTPVEHVLAQFTLPGRREVMRISNLYCEGVPVGVHEGGTYWHTDMSYKDEPAVFTALHAHHVPRDPAAGATAFIDCQAAYQRLVDALARGAIALPDDLDLDAAMVLHRFGNREQLSNPGAATQALRPQQAAEVAGWARHPLVLRHPASGQRSLYAIAATGRVLEGWPASESIRVLDHLLAFVLEHAPRYTHRHRPGDIVVWDNLSTLHRGPAIAASTDEHDCRLLYRMNLQYSSYSTSAERRP